MAKTKSKVKSYTFIWTGKNADGATITGETQGISFAAVKAFLRSEKIMLIKIKKKPEGFGLTAKAITSRDITVFTRQLATMLKSGIPLVQSFDIASKGQLNPKMGKLIANIRADVEEGHSFKEALRQHPKYFNNLYSSLVNAGEQSGTLDEILLRLATYKEKAESLKGKIRKAMFYPAAIIVVAILVSALLLVFVVPQFESLFKSFGAELPYLTQVIIRMSQFMQAYWLLLLIGIGITSGIVVYSFRHIAKFKFLIHKLSLKIPILGPILEKAIIARFTRTLATTFSAGVPLIDALKTVAE
ncbi:unnamed protein product, partial [marine sediment metagenome]